jgi:hypothetical protein
MLNPEIILVTLSNNDVALFVNGVAVHTLEATETGSSPSAIGEQLASALGTAMQYISMDVPQDSEWNWSGVYERVPRPVRKPHSVHVKHWDAYQSPGTTMTHAIDVDDQRSCNGQMFIDVGAVEGSPDDMLSVTLEINTNVLNGIDHVPCAHIHFDSDNLAVSLFKIGNRILVRPETQVSIEPFTATVNGFAEALYWIS